MRAEQEIIFYKWNHEWDDELKSELMPIAEEFGCSWMDVVMACIQAGVEEFEDPIVRQRLIRDLDRREAPFRKDPLAG